MTSKQPGTGASVSAVILAGGRSSRMGRSKAELPFGGGTFLSCQADKLRALGIRDIVVSGYPAPPEGARCVGDVFPDRGPLGGIHAGLQAIAGDRAVVLAVDTPLVPGEFLRELIARHRGGVTLASLRGRAEPLIGVYDKALVSSCERILRGEDTSIRRLLETAECSLVEFPGDPRLLTNCNSPEEYDLVLSLAAGGCGGESRP